MKKRFLICLFYLTGLTLVAAQSAERRAGELIVQLRADASLNTVLTTLGRAAGTPVGLKEVLAPDWRMYLLEFNEQAANPSALLSAAWKQPDVQLAQWNHRSGERNTTPNDPKWTQQANMELIGLPEVWDVATGGVTPEGDTIVVAVLEKGALRDHPDLAPNMWFNRGEIPNNNIDDDGNGYIDDFRGYNPRTKDDDPGDIGFHGTAVNGIIGARGNNNLGVAGVNWTVKLMNLGNVEYESEIVAAYAYVAKMRKLYNTTNRAKGAFVVATNASFGIDFERASDHPAWCAAYDSLGAVGVLSVSATTNSNVNVDIQGDMPSTCPSPYLIVVNSVDNFDKKTASTGYGPINVDIGAPGDSYSTCSQQLTPTYCSFPGTSASAPHVSGAIGLLYSLECGSFSADALTQPAACAKRVHDIVLENVSPNTTLQSITSSGGRLDVARAAKAVQDLCGGATTGPLQIQWVRPNPVLTTLRARFQTPTYSTYQIRIFNMLGQLLHEESYTPDPFSQAAWEYDASQLPKGVYTISFGRNDAVRSEKFVKN